MHPPFLVTISWIVKKTEPVSAYLAKADFFIVLRTDELFSSAFLRDGAVALR